jgi:hypothetical protein
MFVVAVAVSIVRESAVAHTGTVCMYRFVFIFLTLMLLFANLIDLLAHLPVCLPTCLLDRET